MGQKQSKKPCQSPKSHLLPLGDPPFISECEVYHEDEGGPDSKLLFEQCEKNPGHPNFIPVRDLSIEHLPPDYRSNDIFFHLRHHCDRTVRVSVNYTSRNRPDTYPLSTSAYHFSRFRGSNRKRRWGTGTIDQVMPRWYNDDESTCPCHLCLESDSPELDYLQLAVVTATHVVFDNEEAKHTVFELFYDSEDREEVKLLYGVQVLSGKHDDDMMFYRCSKDTIRVLCVTHDKDLFDRFEDRMIYNESINNPSIGFVISHPHGCCKHITIGNVLHYNYSISSLKDPKKGSIFRRIPLKSITGPEDSPTTFLFKLRQNIKCKLPENSTTQITQPLERFFIHSHSMKCASRFELRRGLIISLPPDATFLCRNNSVSGRWMELPEDTKISFDKGREWFDLPKMKIKVGTYCFDTYFITYDIPTCPGSSGAMITTSFYNIDAGFRKTHSGCLVKDGTNRSALLDRGFVQQ